MTTSHSPAAAWSELAAGNARFVAGSPEHPHSDVERRTALAAGQEPFAAVLGCSDSRVAAELVFDRGLGDLFVVRTAGHVTDAGVLGSVEFAVGALGVPLVVVLGHDACGAVAATIGAHATGDLPGGFVRDIVERVTPSVLATPRTATGEGQVELGAVVARHAELIAAQLIERSPLVAGAVAAGSCAVVPAVYHLADGRVEPLADTPA